MAQTSENTLPRHGSAADRGAADRYYGRPFDPHFFVGETYSSEKIEGDWLSVAQIAEYTAAFNGETDRKVW